MLMNRFASFWPLSRFLIAGFAIALMVAVKMDVVGQQKDELLKQGGSYQAADDTSDRAVELYRQLIAQYPGTREAEAAQFSTGGYYSRKFFIIERREKTQNWESFNKAEEALYKYLGMYPDGLYAADAYHALAMIALRRGYTDNAMKLWGTMKEVADKDPKVYISKEIWPTNEDVTRGYCDAQSLAYVGLSVAPRLSFYEATNVLADWVRNHCSAAYKARTRK